MEQQGTSGGRSIRTVKIWIKAFIPNTYERARLVPGTSEHAGKTMITDTWLLNRCFLTDQRTFSSDIHAEARMHSEIEIDIDKCKETYQFHHCYDTVELDCASGKEKCRAQGDTKKMRFYDFECSAAKNRFTIKVNAGSKNPCVKVGLLKVAPNLDYEGTITLLVDPDPSRVIVTFEGKIEKYPAFEMYAAANGSAPVALFQVDVAPSASIGDLPGGPERPISGRAELRE